MISDTIAEIVIAVKFVKLENSDETFKNIHRVLIE